MTSTFDLRALIHDGGFIMAPLVACSVIATTVIVERAIALFGVSRRTRREAAEVLALVRRGALDAASERARGARTAIAPALLGGIERAVGGRDPASAIERERLAAVEELRRGLWILGTIGASAPFIGLFGTVVGIIRSFAEIASTGHGGFSTVAAGISEALIATGSGIVVAVIAFGAHNDFQTRVASIATRWRLLGDELREALADVRPGAAARAPLGARP
jgi:biopolymer transport protein ExbB